MSIDLYNKNLEVVGFLMLDQNELLSMYIEINKNTKEEKLEETEREKTLKKLQKAGILDEDGNLIGPYKEIFIKNQKVIDNWKKFTEEQKNDIPNIPIINAKNYRKTLSKK